MSPNLNPTDAELRAAIIAAGGDPDATIEIAPSEEEHWARAIVEINAHYAGARTIAVTARADAPLVGGYLMSGARAAALCVFPNRTGSGSRRMPRTWRR